MLVAEVLACNIQCHLDISGLTLSSSSVPLPPLSQYADDTSIIVTTDRAILATFEVYDLYQQGSGAKLNPSKCKGLRLGAWNGRMDCPVAIEWGSVKLKILGVFLGPLASPEHNWRPRISAVENVLLSWRQRSLSYRGKAVIINALALSRIWYVASLVYTPPFVLRELSQLVFKFFWSGKRDLVARWVVHPTSCGGFSVVDVELKVWALLLQWVRRLSVSPSTWVSFFSFWCVRTWGVSPVQVLSAPSRFCDLRRLPCFYRALLSAWSSAGGCFLHSRGTLSVGSGLTVAPVSSLTTKSAYSLLLIDRSVVPHCVEKFSVPFGQLYWSTTWRQLFFFDIDRPVIDLSWKIAHGVLYTAERLASFVMASQLSVFVVTRLSLWSICFFTVLWQPVFSPGFIICSFVLLRLLVLFCRVMFCLVSLVMISCVFLGFLCMLLMFVSFLFGWPEMTFVFVMSGQEPSRSWSVLNLGYGFTFLFSSVVSSRRAVAVILSGSGVLTVFVGSVRDGCLFLSI